MLRVTTLYASSAAATASYYTQYLAQAPGEVPGEWAGKQAAGLRLAGPVDASALQALLEGHNPITGTRLGNPLQDRTLASGRVVRAVAGFDATFSAPKSVSVLWALTQDPRLLEVHDIAVTAALRHLERFGSTTRVRAGDRRLHPDSQGLTMARFRQTTSRADDPQLHTHAVVSAKVQTTEGRWLALDARYLKKHQRMLGGLYQTVLRNELAHRFGIAWEPIVNGQAEISGMPFELLQRFSKRTSEVDVALDQKTDEFRAREGRDPTRWERAALTREAAADTRAHKTGNGVAELVSRWLTEAGAAGWSPGSLIEHVVAAGRGQLDTQPDMATVPEIIATMSMAGSTWNRADVLRAVCDIQRPVRAVSGERWAEALERACDTVIATCVELDPADATAPRRTSDGRSLWLEPIAPHMTSERILAEEHLVLTWAMDAQHDDPHPSTSVRTDALDIMQTEVAAAVAGTDRLVLAVGPAGAGKTTTLRSAVDDLVAHGRPVFGVAPSAKAARVLKHETGMAADTLAKLLHEWERTDRGPLDRYRLPPGSTILVDEAGMVGTPALARLVSLAERNNWRLALIGDHHQLQAVGRGGLFQELCDTGRAIELTRIHRFDAAWEAAASLQLRRGDPLGLDAYIQHGRVFADTFDNHLETIAATWLRTAARDGTAAITASSNEHVDAINVAVQQARMAAGEVDEFFGAQIGGGEHAHLGDIVVTRRNERGLETTRCEPIRNRELWTVTGLKPDGSIAVSSLRGSGDVLLPASYAQQHVRLGYAATEHGNQGDTVNIGIELATAATTRRGLYVGVTRGRAENLILVVTDSRDLDEARDVLEGVLASDRADVPATTQRRALASADRVPGRQPSRTTPRCEIPPWFSDLRSAVSIGLSAAQVTAAADVKRLEGLQARLASAQQLLATAQDRFESHRPALDSAYDAVQMARERQWAANNAAFRARGLKRRPARREVDAARRNYEEAVARHKEVEAVAEPARAVYWETSKMVRDVESVISSTKILNGWPGAGERVEQLSGLSAALDDWRDWASGSPMQAARVPAMVAALKADRDIEPAASQALAAVVERWAGAARIELAPVQQQTEPPTRSVDIGIGR